ncbi:hypothetical protein BJY24_002932 [Nocardia transvalensis]|uniref:DUF3592 domain-containing protein n=1 Tax=Nocardia transvalensis TaxID=37333 RepID=A0A7W9PDS0_9NOCA|nr:DUF3592 domain-containing protein [Nocardia transvalensis]MBB5914065.1 hypothetical protein [Nocardia transvalensis]
MGWHVYPALWCGVWGMVALVGYGRSLAGVTGAQRKVRVVGRIQRVREPRHRTSQSDGISVVVSFRDPDSGQDVTVTNDGECGERIDAAWVGREIGVLYPPGSPHAYRFTSDPWDGRYGLGWPNFAVFLIYGGLVVAAAIEWGWPWALLGFGIPLAFLAARYLPENTRRTNHRIEKLASRPAVPGRVIAVLEDIDTDQDGGTFTRHMPVVSFTTHEGAAVIAYCDEGLPDPAKSYGRNVTIHYVPEDPADFTLDLTTEYRSRTIDIACTVGALLIGVAAVSVGAGALWGGR